MLFHVCVCRPANNVIGVSSRRSAFTWQVKAAAAALTKVERKHLKKAVFEQGYFYSPSLKSLLVVEKGPMIHVNLEMKRIYLN